MRETQRVAVTRRLRVGVGIEGRLAETFARPEAATADLVRIGFARDMIGQTGCARMRWRKTAGKASDRHIETAPEEMHGARLPKKSRAELFEHPVHFDQRAPELMSAAGVVRGVLAVVLKRYRVRDLDRRCPDPHLQP